MAQPFRHQCAALRIKPNSNILQHEDELRTAQCVDLTNNYIGGTGVQALTDILKNNTKLDTLILHSNGLSNEAVVFLCRALRHHPTLKFLDLSGNPISLPAGLALLQYVHATATVEEIKLDGTLIDELLVKKINRCININRASRSAKPAPAVQATLAHIRAEFDEKKAVRDKAKKIRSEVSEQLSNSTMRELAGKATLPPRDPESGWLIINIYASTTPDDFFSELQILNNEVIPTLNETFHERKTFFVLSSLYHGLNSKQRAALPRTCHADVKAALNKAPTIFLQFLGDRTGEFADLAESESLQKFERENTPAAARGMCLYLVRQCAKLLKLPAALVPLYSDDPQLVHPDTTTSLVKNALLEARGIPPPPAYDPKLAHARWTELEKQKKEITEHGSKFASMAYKAEFDSVDAEGNIHLKSLEFLSTGITRRITAFIDLLLAAKDNNSNNNTTTRINSIRLDDNNNNASLNNTTTTTNTTTTSISTVTPTLQMIQKIISSRCALLPGRKSLTGKLDLYCVTPPSRNSLLLTHEAGAGATTLLAALNSRLEKRPGFIIASHYVNEPLLVPSTRQRTSRDAKSMFLSLTQALLTAHSKMLSDFAVKEANKNNNTARDNTTDVLAAVVGNNNNNNTSSSVYNNNNNFSSNLPTTIKQSIIDDLDVYSAKQLFIQTLTDVAAEALPKSTVVVILVDGIDHIEFPENPCDALRRHEATGADDWPSTDPNSTSSSSSVMKSSAGTNDQATNSANNKDAPAPVSSSSSSLQYDDFEWVPTCLAKNVRFVLTCEEGSRAHQTLEVRGHDSCDVVAVPELGDADFEAIMSKLCELNNVADALTEIDLATIRTKVQFRSPQYLQFVLESLITAQLTPQYQKRSTALSALPETIDRCCEALLDQFENEFGLPLATLVCTSLAACARSGGILDVHLREIIQRMRISRGEKKNAKAEQEANLTAKSASTSAYTLPPLINNNEFERVLRLLRPVLDQSSALVAASAVAVGPISASFHYVNIRCSNFVDCIRRRYLASLDAAAASHKHMAHFYLRHCDHQDPFQLASIRAAAYHVVESGLWDTLEERVLSLPFLSMVMRRKQAGSFFAVLVRAFNLLQPVIASAQINSNKSNYASTESTATAGGAGGFKPAPPSSLNPSSLQQKKGRPTGATTTANGAITTAGSSSKNAASPSASQNQSTAAAVTSLLKPTHQHIALLQLLREYIYFIRRHFRVLAQTPHLVAQLALLLPVDNTLSIAASELLAKRNVPRFVPVLGRTRNVNLHHGLVSGAQFTPSGLRIATGSHDGTVKVSNVMGEVVHTIRDGAAKVLFIKYSQTSRYLVAACENHVILVIDAASGQVVSKIRGHSGAIKCLSMTARGRSVLAGYEDRDLWVWDSETGRHISTITHQPSSSSGNSTDFLQASQRNNAAFSSQFAGVNAIIPHPTDERVVYSVCDRHLVGSRILHSTSATADDEKSQQQNQQFETLLNIVGHSSLPLAAESCYVVCDGTFALLCARDLVQQPTSFVRSESNLKVFSLQTGRMIAAFVHEAASPSNAPSAVSCIVSPDERWLVAGSLDGKMRIYQPDWRTYSTIDDSGLPEPTSVRPSRVLQGFADMPPRLMRFAFDSKSFLATAGGVARVWPTSTATTSSLPTAEAAIRAQDDNMMAGFDLEARVEFATATGAAITSCDWSPNPSDDGAEVVLGDERGKLYCLREQV